MRGFLTHMRIPRRKEPNFCVVKPQMSRYALCHDTADRGDVVKQVTEPPFPASPHTRYDNNNSLDGGPTWAWRWRRSIIELLALGTANWVSILRSCWHIYD